MKFSLEGLQIALDQDTPSPTLRYWRVGRSREGVWYYDEAVQDDMEIWLVVASSAIAAITRAQKINKSSI
ncbi:MAG: hypothetical protein F6K42_25050 [Leptolyngbya sp. SIO1D8]|nr:hypothetical protein [Leptolyngbya sp. SIO1D8]